MIPWQRYMEIAFGVLRLSPSDFWAMTPAEFHAALDGYIAARRGGGGTASAPTRAELEELMRRFPDDAA